MDKCQADVNQCRTMPTPYTARERVVVSGLTHEQAERYLAILADTMPRHPYAVVPAQNGTYAVVDRPGCTRAINPAPSY